VAENVFIVLEIRIIFQSWEERLMTKCMVTRVLHYHIRERFNCRCSFLALSEHLISCLPERESLLLLLTSSSPTMRFTCPVRLSEDTANLRLYINAMLNESF
jgi:hypothetical protein